MIIGITGKAGSGKDVVAREIQKLNPENNWQVKRFSGKVKEVASIIIGCRVTKFESHDFKKKHLTQFNMTVRELLQKIGTECMRDNLHPDVWVLALFSEYNESEDQNWIVTDVRFRNEAQAIKDRSGIIIRLTRNWDSPDQHPSEKEVEGIKPDFIIDNKNQTLKQTKQEVKKLINELNLKKMEREPFEYNDSCCP